jgi:UDP-N-acetyl-D-mannosaminuronic acid dehydrogenase
MLFNKISVVGLGYIGLPTAAMFASKKIEVIGVDTNLDVIKKINNGEIHIIEPGLDILVKEAVKNGFLKATLDAEPADVFLVAVPTPFISSNSENSIPKPDLSYIEAASRSIAKVLKKGDLVILESTSPVGATEKMASWISAEREDLTFPQTHGNKSDIRIAYCPERVLPGNVIKELVENDRVIGGLTENCTKAAIDLYKIFVKAKCISTNAKTAEMVKLTENASRDVAIAFANELSFVCDKLDIDVWELINIANYHPRVNILQPGPGVGGHCIAVDPWFIISSAPEDTKLMMTARNINDSKPEWVMKKIKYEIDNMVHNGIKKTEADIKIACYGLTFKANIDDLRESPALLIAKIVSKTHNGKVMFVEPNISNSLDDKINDSLVDLDYALSNADIHVVLVDHEEFKNKRPDAGNIVDTRGIWS